MPKTSTPATTKTRRNATRKPKKPDSGIIAIDNGGHFTKIFSEFMDNPIAISSKKGIGHNDFKIKANRYGEDTYKIEYDGVVYFTGDLLVEAEGRLTSYTNTKTTDYFTISILQAIALHGYRENIVITCTPYKRFTEDEVNGIIEKIQGKHKITINDVEYEFDVHEVVVFPEVTPAYFNDEPEGKIHWLDLGSRTIGYATTLNGTVIEKETGTIERMGLDIRETKDMSAYASEIANHLLRKWDSDEEVRVFGGGADHYPEVVKELQNFFSDVYSQEDGGKFFQVMGMLEAGRQMFYAQDEAEDDE